MTTLRCAIQIAAIVLSLYPALAVAQKQEKLEKQADREARERVAVKCKAARIILTAPRDLEPADRWALSYVTICSAASDALRAVWTHPPTRADLLQELVAQSRQIADRRILNAVLAVVQFATDEALRRAALNVILAQYNPTVTMTSLTWESPENASLGRVADYYQVPGEQPITAADRQHVVEVFHQLSTTASTPLWRRVAARVASDLPRFR